ncbi:AhpC/TSA family protein [Ancylomarina euxinus]|uniref:AhpC/TSA family protein n=1 Tax=Ancylomarina euxinus TaxID=2283627 RepID=A0A425XZB0_9BACT|nr:TlpA disulfide reductase family protein [Ancylomarina euxinus]MCZ4695598.1 TlpA disulfide reductase family protein [Ancylomarina euxinus]MUP15979.1 redoxin domain-containing protein [Ancylomarina euxinus]RRG20421.1 AhpC/TSA family protein [Ancylomarina euxinus]
MRQKYLRHLLPLFVIIGFYACDTNNPHIKGTISGENWEKIYLYAEGIREPLDSAVIKNNRFEIDTKNLKSQICYIGIPKNTVPLFVVPTSIKTSLTVSNGKILMEVSGSPEHSMFEKYRKELNQSKEQIELQDCVKIMKKEKQNNNDSIVEKLKVEYQRINDEYWQMVNLKTEQLIQKNQNSPWGLYLFYRQYVYFKKFYTQEKIDSIRQNYLGFGERALASVWTEKIEEILTKSENSVVGKMAPDLTGTDTLGLTKNLSDFRGKYVLVDFWASWCYWCRLETPNFKKAVGLYDDNQLAVLGVSFDSKEKLWRAAIEEDESHWNQLLVTLEEQKRLKKAYAFSGIPHIILLDPQGKILARDLRGEEIINTLKKYLKK